MSRKPCSSRSQAIAARVRTGYPSLTRRCSSLSGQGTEVRELQVFSSPLTDSNRRPPLYEEGPCVNWSVRASPSQGGCRGGGWRAVLISLSPPGVEDMADGSSLRWRISLGTVRRPGGRWRLWERRVGCG